jgi:hypothetical protein
MEPFASELRAQIDILSASLPKRNDRPTLIGLASRARKFIACAVWQNLYHNGPPRGLELITDLASSEQVNVLDVFTLNHDVLLETALGSAEIPFSDGFGDWEGDLRYFDASQYAQEIKRRIYKLHGSINWWRFPPGNGGRKNPRYAVAKNMVNWAVKNELGYLVSASQGEPILLAGTYNKISTYGTGIFAELHHLFHNALLQHDTIVMSGYGWNDSALNVRLLEWLFTSPNKRLILLHNAPEDLKMSRSALRHQMDGLVQDGRLVLHRKWLCDTTIEDLFGIIDETRPG